MKKQLLAAALLACASFGAYAQSVETENNLTANSFTYIEVGAARTTLDPAEGLPSVDFDGFIVRGSVDIADEFHVFGAYQQGDADDENYLPMDLYEAQLGFGWHPKISDNANAILEASYIHEEIKVDFFGEDVKADDDLYRVSAGLRGAFGEHFAGTLKAHYTDTSNADGEFSASVGAEVRFNKTWSLVGDAEIGDDMNHYMVGVRASF